MKKTQTTDKKAVIELNDTLLADTMGVEEADIQTIKSFLNGGSTQLGYEIVKNWVQAGRLFSIIKEIVGKTDFNEYCNRYIGVELDKNQRSYAMRLGKQPEEKLENWYIVSCETATGPKAVFERWFAANPADCIEPSSPKVSGGSKGTKKAVTVENGEDGESSATWLRVSQAYTQFNRLEDKCREAGNMGIKEMRALILLMESKVMELTEALRLEEKALAVEKERENRATKKAS